MSLLGFDTSTAATTACLLRADGESFEVVPEPAALFATPAHARELMPRLVEVLARGDTPWAEVEAIAVGVGPGAFTGLRIGVATARALAHARDVELRPVSSLAALAEGIEGDPRLPVLDARRGEVFAALHGGGGGAWPAAALSPEALAERLRSAGAMPWAAGDGSVRFRGLLEAAGARVAPDGSTAHVVRALHVCRLASAVEPVAPEAVLPDYMRAPDAKPRP